MNTQINNYQQNNHKLLIAETVFKGTFNKRQLINHLSDNIAPKEAETILNGLLKDKLVKIGRIKDILEIEEAKLNKLKGVVYKPGPKATYKSERKKRAYGLSNNQRVINYKFIYRKKFISLYYQFSYKNLKHTGTVPLNLDTDIDTIDVETILDISVREKYQDLKDFTLMFNRMSEEE